MSNTPFRDDKLHPTFAMVMSQGSSWTFVALLVAFAPSILAGTVNNHLIGTTWEAPLFIGAILVTLALSLVAAAGLKAMMERTSRLWLIITAELWLLFQLALVATFSRLWLTDFGKLSSGQAVIVATYLILWGFLVGYVAKIPWDRAANILSARLLRTYAWRDGR